MAAFTESEMEDEFEGEEEEEVNTEPAPGFAIGEVVFPVEKEKDFVDPTAILINHADTYVGKNLAMVSRCCKLTSLGNRLKSIIFRFFFKKINHLALDIKVIVHSVSTISVP